MKRFGLANFLSGSLVFGLLAACSGAPPSRVNIANKAGSEANPNKPGTVPGELGGGMTPGVPVELPKDEELKFKLSDTSDSDAYDFTFGAAKIELETNLLKPSIKLSKFLVSKKGGTLSAEQIAFGTRLCKDIDLSTSAKNFEAATGASPELYLLWRSHFGADLKTALADYLAKEGEPLSCAVLITQEENGRKESAQIILHALSEKTDGLIGSSKLEQALKEGLLLVAEEKAEKLDEKSLIPISDAAKVSMQVPALNSLEVKLEATTSTGETCYLVENGSTTKPYNPKSKTTSNFKVAAKAEFSAGEPKAKVISGQMIKGCEKIKVASENGNLNLALSCSDYFEIKDAGNEAACAWEIPVANKADSENALALALTLDKFMVKTRDGSRIKEQTSESTIPISGINSIRDGQIDMRALSKGQSQLLEDGLDVWIAIGEKSYRDFWYNHIKTIGWDGACNYGAYAQFNSQKITWCKGGALTEDYTARRFQDPGLLLYRAMLAWHEAMHTKNLQHDVDARDYEPCKGTAGSAEMSVFVLENCKFDYCKQLKPVMVQTYKSELNYSYNGDNTGRKSRGLCKQWSQKLGVSGGGF